MRTPLQIPHRAPSRTRTDRHPARSGFEALPRSAFPPTALRTDDARKRRRPEPTARTDRISSGTRVRSSAMTLGTAERRETRRPRRAPCSAASRPSKPCRWGSGLWPSLRATSSRRETLSRQETSPPAIRHRGANSLERRDSLPRFSGQGTNRYERTNCTAPTATPLRATSRGPHPFVTSVT